MLTQSLEDYLEAIFIHEKDNNGARLVDIAEHLEVKKSSVTEAVKKLAEKGYVVYEKYKKIKITRKGKIEAKKIYEKHVIITNFLVDVLKINKKIAEKEACEIEHCLSSNTVEKLTKFLKREGKYGKKIGRN